MSTGRVWTEEEVIALGVKCSVAHAASIIGLGKHKAYRLLRAGEFPLPTFEVDGRTWVPTRPIRELLGIESQSFTAGTSPAEVPPAVETARGESRHGPPLVSVPRTPTSAKGEVRVENTRR